MKLKGNSSRERMLSIVKKDGRVGSKDVTEILRLKSEDKLLEAFFSIICRIEYQLKANFHNKFHVNWKKINDGETQSKDINRLWEEFNNSIDRFSTIIFISYSTNLVDKKLYQRLTNIRLLRNQIAHNLTYCEPEIFVTKKEVRSSIEDCIQILNELENTQTDIVFLRK